MIRLATVSDLTNIMEIIKEIVKDMKEEKNPQWHDGYPAKEDMLRDIERNSLYVLEENNEILGFICILEDLDNDYASVKESSNEKAYIAHRLGVNKNYRNQQVAQKLMGYVEDIALNNGVYLIKADTEVHNLKMNNLFVKLGYKKLGELVWSDNDGTFNYYEKDLRK